MSAFLHAQSGSWDNESTSWSYFFNSGQRNLTNVTPSIPANAIVTTEQFSTSGSGIQSTSSINSPGWLPAPPSGTSYIRLAANAGGQYNLIGTGEETGLKITQSNGLASKFSVYGITDATSVAKYSFHLSIGNVPEVGPLNAFMRLAIGNNKVDIFTTAAHLSLTESPSVFGLLSWTYTSTKKVDFSFRKKLVSGNAVNQLIDNTTFEKGGEYDIEIYCNNYYSNQSYTKGGVKYDLASGFYHIWVNGNRIVVNGKTNFPEGLGARTELEMGDDLNSFVFAHGNTTSGAANTSSMTIKNLQISFVKKTILTQAGPSPDPNFHLYNLIGQSNMAGRGGITSEYAAISHPRVKMLNEYNEWVIAKHPLHFDSENNGAGPGLAFAIKMAEANPNITIGLIPSAVGATPADSWQPGAFFSSKAVYPYDEALIRAKIAMRSGVMKGILYHQGEDDSSTGSAAWPAKVKALVNNLRREFKDDKIPFILGELSYARATSYTINNLLPTLVSEIPYSGFASAAGLTAYDNTHFDAPSYSILGERFAVKMLKVQQDILAVKLLSFKPLKLINGVQLLWETSNELNHAWFEIERSTDAKVFTTIGKVVGSGNSNVNKSYTFYDNTPISGTNYYRLKQIDYEGVFDYSPVVVVNYNLASNNFSESITIYPNPAADEVNILINKNISANASRILIYDLQGKKVDDKKVDMKESLKYDIKHLKAGLYYLELRDVSNKILGKAKLIKNL